MNTNEKKFEESSAVAFSNEPYSMPLVVRDEKMKEDNQNVDDTHTSSGYSNQSQSNRMDGNENDNKQMLASNKHSIEFNIQSTNGDDNDEKKIDDSESRNKKQGVDDSDYDAKITELISSLEALQARVDDVIAFPTASNFKKMHHQASSTHSSYSKLSYFLEFGDMKNNKNKDGAEETNVSTTSPTNKVALGEETRSRLTSFGTNIWLNIQNNPELFLDFIPSQTSSDSTAQDPSSTDLSKVQANELDRERAAASGYMRSLACRLILVSKIKTKGLVVPELIHKKKVNLTTKAYEVGGRSESMPSVPIASSGELEFAFKCLYRAGRAIMHHSSPFVSSSSMSTPDVHDPSTAYTTLSLALNVWEGIGQLQKSNIENGKKWSFTDDAFDAMLSLPDCASLMVTKNKDVDMDIDYDVSESCEAIKSQQISDTASLVLKELKRLEEFVNSKVSSARDGDDGLKSIQYFLPSLARISYKHGNRLARLSDFSSSREALRIALCSTDKCLGIIRENLNPKDLCRTKAQNSAIQIQEQEMLILSKQSFYVLSHVRKSTGKMAEARKCLDQIELYINEQVRRDEEQYKETMRRISKSNARETESFAGLSGFALEGPKKQDMAEIKNRVTSARGRAKYGEMIERINLAYSRIMMSSSSDTILEEEEKMKDSQFQLMVELTKEIETNKLEYKPEFHSQTNYYASPMHQRDTLDLTLSAARSIFVQRETSCINHQYRDPYDVLCAIFSKGTSANMIIRLEFLNSMLFVVEDIRDKKDKMFKCDISSIDKRALDTGKEVMSQLMVEIAPSISNAKVEPTKSTLFRSNKGETGLDLTRVLSASRDYFTRAVSLYFSSQDGQSKAAEWCDLLVEVLGASQQHAYACQKEELKQESSNHVISEIMATKALSLSMTNCHGAALKTAREAWEKYGAEIGNLVTLFHCSVQYEVFSDMDDPDKGTFGHTLFELDNSISSFLSLSKLSTSAEVNYEKLLEAFPVMCNTAAQIEQNQTGPLLLGLQERYMGVLMKLFSLKLSEGAWDLNCEGGKVGGIPGENSMFDVLTAYLANFDRIISSGSKLNQKWYSEQYQNLQKTLGIALKGLISVRDQFVKDETNENNLLQFSEMFKDSQPPTSDKSVLLFENNNVRQLIGSSADCLWTAEQLWNIATQIMTKDDLAQVKGESISSRLHAAELYSKAHDFALLSEEECGISLTKGYIAFENFDGKQCNPKVIDFKASAKFNSTDICSEFSAQCLLLMIAHILDDVNVQMPSEGTDTTDLSPDQEQVLNRAIGCLIVAMSEIYVLGTQMNETIAQQIIWLALSLLIAVRNDELCSNTLSEGGLLYRLQVEILDKASGSDVWNAGTAHPLYRIFLLSTRSEYFGMRLTTKLLLTLCVNNAIQRGCSYVDKGSLNSVGSIQKKIINFASKVEEVVNIFNAVDEQVKRTSKKDSSSSSSNKNIFPYKEIDIDYFVIEAHNRAVSLLYVGDLINAEKLLTVALNLLPYSGKEVERHGAEIRKVYRGVIEKRCNGDRILSMSSDTMISLFDGRSTC